MPRSLRNYELKRRKNPTRWGGGYRSVAYIRTYPPRHRVCSKENHIMGPTILHTEYILSYFRTKVVEIAQYLWFLQPNFHTRPLLNFSLANTSDNPPPIQNTNAKFSHSEPCSWNLVNDHHLWWATTTTFWGCGFTMFDGVFFKLHAFNKLALHDLYIRGIMYYATKSM